VTRRRLAVGAAWTAPAIIVGSAAPAFAASAGCCQKWAILQTNAQPTQNGVMQFGFEVRLLPNNCQCVNNWFITSGAISLTLCFNDPNFDGTYRVTNGGQYLSSGQNGSTAGCPSLVLRTAEIVGKQNGTSWQFEITAPDAQNLVVPKGAVTVTANVTSTVSVNGDGTTQTSSCIEWFDGQETGCATRTTNSFTTRAP
jgi:hypothetical protein